MDRVKELFRTVDEFGPLHIIVGDGNIEDEHLRFCVPETEDERELLHLLTEMSPDDRFEARDTAWA